MSYGEFKFTCIEDLKIRESALSESSMTLSHWKWKWLWTGVLHGSFQDPLQNVASGQDEHHRAQKRNKD
jgi:hypothetical protein